MGIEKGHVDEGLQKDSIFLQIENAFEALGIKGLTGIFESSTLIG